MKKFALFLILFGVASFIYNFCAYFSGLRSIIHLIFSLLLSFYFIFTGLDGIFSWQQTRPRLYKYVVITYMIVGSILFIAFIVDEYMSRG